MKADGNDRYSKKSIAWIESLQNPNIVHAMKGGGEVKICGAKVDGYDPTTPTVYQYHGCFYCHEPCEKGVYGGFEAKDKGPYETVV